MNGDWIAAVGAWPLAEIIAVVSALAAVISFTLNAKVVRRQQDMAFEDLKLKLDSDILAWGRDAVSALAEAERFIASAGLEDAHATFERERLTVMQHLSGLADQGRFYFPNMHLGDGHGDHKEAAFRGHRPPIIHAIIFAYYAVKRFPEGPERPTQAVCALLMRCRRLVVSEVQAAIDPRRRTAAFKTLSKAKDAERSRAGLTETAALAADVEALFPGVLEDHNDRIVNHNSP